MDPFFLWIYSNGAIWFSKHAVAEVGAAGLTLVTCLRINDLAKGQLITTLGGTVSSSLTATGGTGATITATVNPTTETELT
jgi:hypothetical protein